MNLEECINTIIHYHPEFSYEEVQELCLDYLSQFKKKTKEESKLKSLKKYLNKEFWLDLFKDELLWTPEYDSYSSEQPKITPLKSIPKSYFQWKQDNKDYILKLTWFSKQLGKTVLFEDAELKIKYWEKIALIWKNWAWKSTLLKVLIWKENIDQWLLEIPKWIKIWFMSQDIFWESKDRLLKDEMLTALPDITAKSKRLDEINESLKSDPANSIELVEEQNELIQRMINNDWYQKYWLQTEILKYFWFTKDQLNLKISQLSWWEQTKVQIAKFLLQEVDLLILDEPTNHLDIEWIMFLQRFCELWQKTLICISHDKKFLNSSFQKIVEISNKKLFEYKWNYDDFIAQKEKNHEIQMKNYVAQQKYLEKQEAFIERFRYKATKASQVQSRIKLLDKMEKIEMPENDITTRNITFKLHERLPNFIMELDELSIWYNWNTLISLPKKIEITKDMRIWIIWKNWIWKTTLIKTILWELNPLYWWVQIHENLKIWSYSQALDWLDYESTIVKEIVWPWISIKDARSLLGSLLIDNEKMDQKIWTLSGWEKAKVALTKMLLSQPQIIIMDEPTNHLDLWSKETIKNMLTEFNWVSIIVSHDRDFLEWTSNLLRVLSSWQLEVYHDLERWFQALEESCWIY